MEYNSRECFNENLQISLVANLLMRVNSENYFILHIH